MMADREKKENDNIKDEYTSEEEPSIFDEDLTEKEIA
jgi:hypothetical protein